MPKVYGDKQQVDVTHEAGGSYLDLLQQVNQAAQIKHASVVEAKAIEIKENTHDKVRARDKINQNSVNKKMHKKQANKRK